MKLKDIKTLITSGTILLAVGLYLIFSEPKQETEQTDSPAITEQNSVYTITPEVAMDKTGKQLVDVKFLNANDGLSP